MKIFISNLNESWIIDRMKEEFSTYNPDIVTNDIKNCDIIFKFEKGRLVSQGSYDKVIGNSK